MLATQQIINSLKLYPDEDLINFFNFHMQNGNFEIADLISKELNEREDKKESLDRK